MASMNHKHLPNAQVKKYFPKSNEESLDESELHTEDENSSCENYLHSNSNTDDSGSIMVQSSSPQSQNIHREKIIQKYFSWLKYHKLCQRYAKNWKNLHCTECIL